MAERKFNLVDKEILKQRMAEDPTPRMTVSFYRYVRIEDPDQLRGELYDKWSEFNVMGRTYLAHEGINAQISMPKANWEFFQKQLHADERFDGIPFKIAVDDDGKSFYKLIIKVRKKIVADGLDDNTFDSSDVGTHLTAREFNSAMEDPESIVVDMRNHYESEVGHFKGAITPDADTFRDELDMVSDLLTGKEDKKLLLYCTGGIRCEKASAWFRHQGFKDVNQLHGGIISYAHQIKEEGLESKFIGKNFVFDERLGERITEDVISSCHQCGKPCDDHTNCANHACHLLFIQCEECAEKYNGCCTNECRDISLMPIEEQRALRKGQNNGQHRNVYKSRLRPHLDQIRNK
jgi:UPF0176 protein